MSDLLLLALGGALGAMARFFTTRLFTRHGRGKDFPWATLLINTLGSIGLGALLALRFEMVPSERYGDPLFLFFGVGFFAAFTTFSTFTTETLAMLRNGRRAKAAIYVAVTLVFCLLGFSLTMF